MKTNKKEDLVIGFIVVLLIVIGIFFPDTAPFILAPFLVIMFIILLYKIVVIVSRHKW